jgi:transcriptional antiterminator RfaH
MGTHLIEPWRGSRPEVAIARDAGRQWVVVRTRPRCEKKFAEFCDRRLIPCYLPLRRSVRRYRHRVAAFMVPVFSGYVFSQIAAAQHAGVNDCHHVARVLVPDDAMETQLVRELQDVQRLERATLEGELEVRPEIRVGRLVVIKGGPLSGLSGIVARRKNKMRLTVNVEMVGQSVSVDVDAVEVEIEL